MVTDDDRVLSLEQADAIYQHCADQGWGLQCQIATLIGYKETMRRGKLAECAFAREFGIPMRTQIFKYGDGGVDFLLRLLTRDGPRTGVVNVKAKSVRQSWYGLMKSGTHLRVPVRECKPTTIYVFGIYLEPTDDAEVLRWRSGRALIERNQRKVFENSNGEVNYIMPFEELWDLRELKDRYVS